MFYIYNKKYNLYSSRYLRKVMMRFTRNGNFVLTSKLFLKIFFFIKFFFKKFPLFFFFYNRLRFLFPIFVKGTRRARRIYLVPRYIRKSFQEKVALDSFVNGVQEKPFTRNFFEKFLLETVDIVRFEDSCTWANLFFRITEICENRMYSHFRWRRYSSKVEC